MLIGFLRFAEIRFVPRVALSMFHSLHIRPILSTFMLISGMMDGARRLKSKGKIKK